ncbi:hypothetical protein FB45DRAFT_1148985 [Roridomyces roridus]|uniref:Uncharacterized protein n=1 Tax=Roridomyces roridus TaxID=1738132 RepID=A0AAD7FRJ9_9AGAR|nr:hypothetical protein FB45DRAFT_1148985 [Roridomyces roridus]
MPLSEVQLDAIAEAQRVLANVGLTTADLVDHDILEIPSRTVSHSTACSPVLGSLYRPPPARTFTAEELRLGLDQINRETYVSALVDHPLGSIVEYPETASRAGVGIAHCFCVEPSNFLRPEANFQYSLGDSHGGKRGKFCGRLLTDQSGAAVSCSLLKMSCKGLKYCSGRSLPPLPQPTLELDSITQAKREVFFKTIAFYCTLVEKGCAFELKDTGDADVSAVEDTSDDSESESRDDSDTEVSTSRKRDRRFRTAKGRTCKGTLEMRQDEFGRSFIQCEHRTQADTAHLILRTLDEFDLDYLRALLHDNPSAIHEREEVARQFGYGPRAPCSYTAPPSAQKDFCPYWHRISGKLARGVLQRNVGNCDAKFDIYTPDDLSACSQVVVICRNPHSHHAPDPVTTPPPLLDLFRSLLLELDWKLADATPRKLMLDSGFMAGFRRSLGWNKPFDPPLAALHPSLGNLDHVRRYIDELRHVLFPMGTDFEGAQLLAAQHSELPEAEQYVRCAEIHAIEGGKPFYLVICMLRSMSARLMRAKKLSLDTAFKRVNGKWQEFEMETWDLDGMKSVIGTRAFTTSQSAQAHLILFTRIFEIAQADTGIPCRFRHIHGDGFELWIADSHKGQSLGAGMFCQQLCANLGDIYCPIEPTRLLRTLNPYEQASRFLRYCTTHYVRNVDKIRPYITTKVRNAMLSLSSSQSHPDFEGALRTIENGGPKANAWLKDKISGNKCALPALYQPASLIPLEIWKSAPSTTNGNEQAHRNINRDGVNLTMLGAIMRGMQYDARAIGSLELYSTKGIYSRDQISTHFRRLQCSLNRHGLVQARVAARSATVEEPTAETSDSRVPTTRASQTHSKGGKKQCCN